MKNWKKAPRDGRSRNYNNHTQPLRDYRVFNNPKVITEGWYPVCPSRSIPSGKAQSFSLGAQRFVVYRGSDEKLRAMDAFCPHMGADLGNGRVVQNDIQCYFHQWQYTGEGNLCQVRCDQKPRKDIQLQTYPVEEKYGTIWIYSAAKAPYPVPTPPGLENEDRVGFQFLSSTLFVHHHVLMAGAIDLQHFASVHQLDIQFQYEISETQQGCFDWNLKGVLPKGNSWKLRLARFLLGHDFGYQARFSGGSIVSLTYGPDQYFRGRGRKLPPLYLLWGCVPLENGVSRVQVFMIQKKRKGLIGKVKQGALFALTFALLILLRDEDAQAFPYMRFNPQNLLPIDRSLARLITLIETLTISPWSFQLEPTPQSTQNQGTAL